MPRSCCDSCDAGCLSVPLLLASPVVLLIAFGFLATLIGTPEPDIFDVRVENGTLHTMEMDYSNSTLTYSLSAVYSFSNKDIDRHTETVAKLAVALMYGGQELGPESSLPTFQLRYLETATVPFHVQGQQAAGAMVAGIYADDAARGYYTIQVKLSLRLGGLFLWCDSSCTLYFFAPSLPRGAGAPNIFDGDDCWNTCKSSVFHDPEEVM